MVLSAILLVFGSVVLSFLLALQVKLISPGSVPGLVGVAVVHYNLYVLPLIFLANTALGMSFCAGAPDCQEPAPAGGCPDLHLLPVPVCLFLVRAW